MDMIPTNENDLKKRYVGNIDENIKKLYDNSSPKCEWCGGKMHIVKSWEMGSGRNKIPQVVKLWECADCGKRKRSYEKKIIEAGVEE